MKLKNLHHLKDLGTEVENQLSEFSLTTKQSYLLGSQVQGAIESLIVMKAESVELSTLIALILKDITKADLE